MQIRAVKMLTQRQKLILKQTIGEYIRTARPVSSLQLALKYFPEFSSATIRNELAQLERQGFLTHPYTSAGRIPTEKGYQYFVERLVEIREPGREIRRRVKEIAGDPWQLSRFIAEHSQALVVYFARGMPMTQAGFREVLSQPEFEDRRLMLEFLDFASKLCRHPDFLIRQAHEESLGVFIGGQIGLPQAKYREFSLLVSHFRLPRNDDVIVSLAGPSRMPYAENLGILKYLEELWS